MGTGLSHPVTSKLYERKGSSLYRVGIASMQGWRDSMEDAHSIRFDMPQHPNGSFFGVFDGHAGDQCSPYIANLLPNNIDGIADWSDHEALAQCSMATDEQFLNDRKYAGLEDGSTGIWTLIEHNKETNTFRITGCNVGDSRAVLARKQADGSYATVPLSFDHKPTDPAEKERIYAAGGTVQFSRVDGQLALSRAFGDRGMKVPMAGPPEKRKVSTYPDFIVEDAKAGDFLFIACDGIYESDVFSRESVIAYIAHGLSRTSDTALICSDVVNTALTRGSKDNMTAMIIQFENGESYHQDQPEYFPGPYDSSDNARKFQTAYKQDAESYGYTLEQALEKRKKWEEEQVRLAQEQIAEEEKQQPNQSESESADATAVASTPATPDVVEEAPAQ
eukprot:TRINITY_DN323_c0_g2_i1.p1 TRINITY_DN323_c0_g2~~TRINITY_DN323_c0_g2_i1.p1  ORF type:complete len:391 (-),score=81.50 TRINITY_DN323_c0_g2_i1:258-1430(-)